MENLLDLTKPSFIREHLFGILHTGAFGYSIVFLSNGEIILQGLAIFFLLLHFTFLVQGVSSHIVAWGKYYNIQMLRKRGFFQKAKIVWRREVPGSYGKVFSYTYFCKIDGSDRIYEYTTQNTTDVFPVGSEVKIYVNDDLFPGLYWIDFGVTMDNSTSSNSLVTQSQEDGDTERDREETQYYFYQAIIGGNRKDFLRAKQSGDFDPEKPLIMKQFIKKIFYIGLFILLISTLFPIIMSWLIGYFSGFDFGEIFQVFSIWYIYTILITFGYCYSRIRAYLNYEKIITYFEQKKLLEEFSKKISKVILDDVLNPEIAPLEVQEISLIISKIGVLIKDLHTLSNTLKSLRKNLLLEAKKELNGFIDNEKNWIFEYIMEFSKVLDYWLKHHEKELDQAADKLEKSQAPDTYSDTIRLAQIQLSNQRELVEKTQKILVHV